MICKKLLEASFSRARRLRWASRSWTRRFLRFWGESCAMGRRVKIIIPENQVERSFWIAARKCVRIAGLQLIQLTFDRRQPSVLSPFWNQESFVLPLVFSSKLSSDQRDELESLMFF